MLDQVAARSVVSLQFKNFHKSFFNNLLKKNSFS